ncbi:MAG: nucleotidyltransferase domain-containing protein [Candidatus Thermoplasmatota archaeon]|nr:nucleotidyltransferase domain-containing protein [Candidatus Thermoplasmatota archaeon]
MRYKAHALRSPVLDVLGRKSAREIIYIFQKYPRREFTINELAREAKVPVMSCWRAVKDLERLGVVTTRKIGKSTAVTLNSDSIILKSLTKLVDPYWKAAEDFAKSVAKIKGVKFCYLFGSVAKGAHKPGSDVDVAVIYDNSILSEKALDNATTEIMSELLEKMRMKVIPLWLTTKEFEKGKKPIIKEIKEGIRLWPKKR